MMNNNDEDITFILLFKAFICYLSWPIHQLYEIGKDHYTHFIDDMGWDLLILSGHLADR